jgi:Flp pilus assembly protein TadG
MSQKPLQTGEDRQGLPTASISEKPASLTHSARKVDKLFRLYRKQRRAAAVVEFAIVAPLFFLLVFGMIEYGRMVMVQQIITNASREGARRAVLDGASATEVQNAVDDFLEQSSIAGADVTLDPADPTTAAYGDPITVTVSIDFVDVSWLPSPMYLGGQEMTASTSMRRETSQ